MLPTSLLFDLLLGPPTFSLHSFSMTFQEGMRIRISELGVSFICAQKELGVVVGSRSPLSTLLLIVTSGDRTHSSGMVSGPFRNDEC